MQLSKNQENIMINLYKNKEIYVYKGKLWYNSKKEKISNRTIKTLMMKNFVYIEKIGYICQKINR